MRHTKIARGTPQISVLMPAYNAEQYIAQSIQSVLAQTDEDFELIVIDDASTDSTRAVVLQYRDLRLRLVDNPRNLGIVETLNRALAIARGRYIARVDADDLCISTRFAKQKAVLDSRPDIVMVSTEMSVLSRGAVRFTRQRPEMDLKALRWTLHLGNPVGHPSMMFRAEAVQRLGGYMRREFQYAEDFDFTHRLLTIGGVFIIPEYLVIYRQHGSNLTVTHRNEMTKAAAAVLRRVYEGLLQEDCEEAAAMVTKYLLVGEPVTDPTVWGRLRAVLFRLVDRFQATYGTDVQQRRIIAGLTNAAYWGVVQRTLAAGQFIQVLRQQEWGSVIRLRGFPFRPMARSAVSGLLRNVRRPRSAALPAASAAAPPQLLLNGIPYEPAPCLLSRPPTLYVVVDTEAEFDWTKPFNRTSTEVTSICRQVLAQEIFDVHGLRPVYLVDYAVASQPAGYEPLCRILDRRGCVIGAHLHPWVNPPHKEEISNYTSFAGNLPPDLEYRKLQMLTEMIEQNLGVRPLFFKAGRYGLGSSTMETLRRLGFKVDFSIMPLADMRSKGGPDFRFAQACPYRTGEGEILSLPMTRGQVGALAPLPPRAHAALHSKSGLWARLPGVLSRTNLLNTVTLTPEGMTAREQISLLQAMVDRGHRTFVLHYHSPSLGMFTPYVQNQAELEAFLENIQAVLRHFFGQIGGLAGHPADLLPPSMRGLVWPALAAARRAGRCAQPGPVLNLELCRRRGDG